jgi:hypothetical protein
LVSTDVSSLMELIFTVLATAQASCVDVDKFKEMADG